MGIPSRDITSDDISIEENSSTQKKPNSSQHQATHAQRTVGSEKKIRKNVAFPEVTDIQLFIPK